MSSLRIMLFSYITIVTNFSNTVRILLSTRLSIPRFCQWPNNVLYSIFLPSRIEFSLGFVIFLVSFILNISSVFLWLLWEGHFQRIQSSATLYLIEWFSFWFVWYFLMINSDYAFLARILEKLCYSSQGITHLRAYYVWLLFIGDNFDHLIKVLSYFPCI